MIRLSGAWVARHRAPARRRGRLLPAAALSLVLTASSLGLAHADNLLVDGDGVTPVAKNPLSMGVVCKTLSATGLALVAIDGAGHPGAGTNVFADDSVVTLAVTSTSDPALAASFQSGNTITTPSDWIAQGNSAVTSAIASAVTVDGTASAVGAHSGTVNYEARGIRSTGGALTRPGSLSVTWTTQNCDSTPPDTTITSGPSSFSNSTSAAFAFSGSDNVTPAASLTYQCSLDGGTFAACSSPKSYDALGNGSHTFDVRATDQAGNVDPTPARYAWTVDTLAPDTQITAHPADPNSSTTATVEFTGTDNLSPVGALTFQCSLDGAAFAGCVSPRSYSGLTAGSHTVAVRAIDQAGNADATPAMTTWLVDTAPPMANIAAHPANLTNQTAASFQFSGIDNNTGPGALSFACSLDGSTFTPCTSPASFSGLGEGVHVFNVRATDLAGNTGDPAVYSWTIDTTAPDTVITDAPTGHVNSGSASVAFTGHDEVSASLTFECRIDAGEFLPCTSPASYSSLADGSHTVWVRATDGAGNADASPASVTWVVDTTPPDTTVDTGPADATNDTSAAFAFFGSDAISAPGALTFECSMDGALFAACTSPVRYDDLSEGSHTFNVRATDEAGNADPTPAVYRWVIDRTPPAVTVIAPSAPAGQGGYFNAADGPVPVAVSATDASGVTDLACTDNGEAVTVDGQSGTSPRTGTVTVSSDGTHSLLCTATDGVGNSGAEEGSLNSGSVKVDTTAPLVTVSPDREADSHGWYNHAVTFSATATDQGSGSGACDPAVTYSGPDNGSASMSLDCTDVAGNAGTGSLNFKYDATAPVNVVSTLDRAPDHNGWYNHTVTASATGTDATSGIDGGCGSSDFSGPDSATASAKESCTDVAGNTASASVTFRYDATAPTMSPYVSPNPVVLNGSAAASPGASDATSGLDSATCGSVDASSVGAKTVGCVATDQAGNPANASASYNVVYAAGGTCLGAPGHQILSPVNANWQTDLSVFKLGSTVPAKFRVCDANGVSIGAPGTVTKFALVQKGTLASSEVVDQTVASTTPDTEFRWSSTDQQWIFNISTKNQPGTFQSGQLYGYRITLNDGSTIDFHFGLK